MFGLMLSIL